MDVIEGLNARQTAMAYCAVLLAYAHGHKFTFKEFCERYGYKPNRHTRKLLNTLVERGALKKESRFGADGFWRDTFLRNGEKFPEWASI